MKPEASPAPVPLPERSTVPLFICGFPKSGTTLLSALLDGHPELLVLPEETHYFRRLDALSSLPRAERVGFLLEHTQLARMDAGHEEDLHRERGDYSDYRDYRHFDFPAFRGELERRFAGTDGSDRALLDGLVATFAEATGQTGRSVWVEKTPQNEDNLDRILAWYPKARILYIVRDPRDTYLSYAAFRPWRSKGDFDVRRFTAVWAQSLIRWRAHAAAAGSDRAMVVRYEDVATSPEAHMRRIAGFLGVRFDDCLLVPTKLGQPWEGNSMHGDSFQGIDTRPIGRWKSRLGAEDLAFIEAFLGKAMVDLGYTPSAPRPGLGARARLLMRTRRRRALAGILLRLYRPFAPRLGPGGRIGARS